MSAGEAQAQKGKGDEVSEARALFMAGRSAFAEGRYATALEYFEKSYELSAKPQMLYNIGQCHDRLRNDEAAIEALQRYLAEAPEAENRRQVEARLKALRAAVQARGAVGAEQEAPSMPDGAEPRAKAEPEEQEPVVGIEPAESDGRDAARDEVKPEPDAFPIGPTIVIGAGAAAAITGTVLMLVASGEGDDVEQAPVGSTHEELRDRLDSAEQKWVVGQVLVALGATAAAGGIAWLVLDGLLGGGETMGAGATASRDVAITATPDGLLVRGMF